MHIVIEGPQLTKVNIHHIRYIQTTKSQNTIINHKFWGERGNPRAPLPLYETLHVDIPSEVEI